MSLLALVRSADAGALFARRGAEVFTVGRFLHDVSTLAEALPNCRYVANLCQDRYRFAVGLGAALLRGQTTLLPPSDTVSILKSVLEGYEETWCLTDGPPPDGLSCMAFPSLPPYAGAQISMPCFYADFPAAILFTSGSTGLPQPHVRSWGLLVGSALSAGREIGADRLEGGTLVGTVPHQHSYGLESLIMLALQHGLVLQAERPFYPADIARVLADSPLPRMLVTTPVHLKLLLSEPGALPQVDLVLSATAPLAPALAVSAEEAFSAPLHEIYGCSEIGQLASRRTIHGDEWRCLEGFTLRQDGSFTWAEFAGDRAQTRLADIIELRDTRHFRLLGRSADLINIAGKRSSLGFLNVQLASVPGVQDGVFVTAGESELGRQYLEAFVVAPGMTRVAVMRGLRQRIDPAFLPRRLHLVAALPRNPIGKLTLAALQALMGEDQTH
jgi:acyl-coenzyme A synthetase/AMP-(fatty) acid ligase